jgi:putative phage-type endonuclease
MIVIDCEQGSPEWFAARLGKVSASRVADVVARTKTGYSTSRANYAAELVAERLTGQRIEGFKSEAMQWGSDKEADARALYEFMRDLLVVPVGLVSHPSIDMACASPDGLIGDHGLVEIKCPNTATHIETLLGGSVPGRYVTQMQWQMACCGRQWCDFVSFDPRMPAEMQLFVQRVDRDRDTIMALEGAVIAFLAEVSKTVSDLQARYALKAAA